ncbi:hypothetical protein [Fodinibius sp.]|uniref:hypothetical protein n=1 Tax=Fodinibius sp. TaxID=1872440 RepID=UPI003562D23F
MSRLASYFPAGIMRTLQRVGGMILLVVLIIPSRGDAQSLPGAISIDEGGELWIEGTAGPVDFSCHAEELSGQGNIKNTTDPASTVTGEGQVAIAVSLPVASLDCGKRKMNRDMYEALKQEQFPVIRYRLLNASLAEEPEDSVAGGDKWMSIRTRGVMEIAGVRDTTTFLVQGRIHDNNKFHVKGRKEVHMDTYDIEPPSTMFGLIRAKKTLMVFFDVTVTLRDGKDGAATMSMIPVPGMP